MQTNDYTGLLREGLIQTCGKDDSETAEKLLLYMEAVLEKNKVMNLTAINDPVDFVIKHFIDSFFHMPKRSLCQCRHGYRCRHRRRIPGFSSGCGVSRKTLCFNGFSK